MAELLVGLPSVCVVCVCFTRGSEKYWTLSLRSCAECGQGALSLFKQAGPILSTRARSVSQFCLRITGGAHKYFTMRLPHACCWESDRRLVLRRSSPIILRASAQSARRLTYSQCHKTLGKAVFPLLSQERLNKQGASGCFPAQTESDRTKKNVNMHYLYQQENSSCL